MKLWARALLGVLFGSSLTLAVHPIGRQFLLGALQLSSPKVVAEMANTRPKSLPRPTNKIAAGVWLQMACEKMKNGSSLSNGELKTLIGLAKQGSQIEKQNAFWLQMAAVFESDSNLQNLARDDWIKASRCQNWNDMQTKRLLQMRLQLAENGGLNQAWTYGYVYFARSEAPAEQIQKYAEHLVAKSDINNLEGLKLRYATICNGSLLRDGSRSIQVGRRGAGIVELATYPPSLPSQVKGYKRIWIAQTTMSANLRRANLNDEARHADDTFRQNEGWLALVQRQSTEDNLRTICLFAVAVSALPGSLMLCSLVGAILLISLKIRSGIPPAEKFSPFLIVPIATISGAFISWVTSTALAGLVFGTAIIFLLVSPRAVRKSASDNLGLVFSFALFGLFLIATLTGSIFLISSSTAGESLLPMLGPTGEYFSDSRLFLAITFIISSFVFLITPTWAIAHRLSTPYALQKTLGKFAVYLAVGALVLCVLSGPLSVYGDRSCGQELQNIVENEPVYYLLPRVHGEGTEL